MSALSIAEIKQLVIDHYDIKFYEFEDANDIYLLIQDYYDNYGDDGDRLIAKLFKQIVLDNEYWTTSTGCTDFPVWREE